VVGVMKGKVWMERQRETEDREGERVERGKERERETREGGKRGRGKDERDKRRVRRRQERKHTANR